MNSTKTGDPFRYYMHDGPTAFSLELSGRLSDDAARELDHARRSASSVARGRALIIDLSYVTEIGSTGREMFRRWHDEGAQFVAKLPQAQTIVESITGQAPELTATAAQHHTWFPFRLTTLWTIALMFLFGSATSFAADLKRETVQTWEQYVEAVSARNQRRLAPGGSFLSIDEREPVRGAA